MMLSRPEFLWLFLLYIPLIVWYIWKHRNANPSLGLSTISPLQSIGLSWKVIAMHFLFAMRLLTIGALIIALCRPQTHDNYKTSHMEGTDILLALDISGSMTATDL